MTYHVVDPDTVEPLDRPNAEARSLSEAADLENLGVRLYRADPGDQVPGMYHYHDRQEEVFYVLSGTMHVETPDREYVVPAGQVFTAAPGSPHRAFVPDDGEETRVLAFGAPPGDEVHRYEE